MRLALQGSQDGVLRWDGLSGVRLSEMWESPGFDDPAFRRAESEGSGRRFAHNGWRSFVRAAGGSGTVDRVRIRDGMQVMVFNCMLPTMDRQVFLADEPLILLYASLSCDLSYHVENQPAIVLNRPELTLMSLPRGLSVRVDVQGGRHQQRVFGCFRHAALARTLGLEEHALPPVLAAAAREQAPFGRLISLPLDQHVAALVADTIDTPLDGEERALQYEGRLIELVAYTLSAMRRAPVASSGRALDGRASELVQRAQQRLARDYRQPPDLDDLARELGTNPNKLRASFKAAYGITMAQFCLERRMREAQQLLIQARLSIAQIGEQVGYASPSAFGAAFASQVGMTPREYRRHRAPISVPLAPTGSGYSVDP